MTAGAEATEPTKASASERWAEYLELAALVETLSSSQKGGSRLDLVGATDEASLTGFAAWASKHGVSHDKLELSSFGEQGMTTLALPWHCYAATGVLP